MNPELKEKWVAALRSGQYKQGKCVLRREDKFCCLGVLCDVVNPLGWSIDKVDNNGTYYYTYKETNASASLPYKLLIQVTSDLEEDNLIKMNDGGMSFSTIADYIEKNL